MNIVRNTLVAGCAMIGFFAMLPMLSQDSFSVYAQEWYDIDYGDYYSGGYSTAGCCETWEDNSFYDYSNYYSGGSPTAYSYDPVVLSDYGDYYSGGSAGGYSYDSVEFSDYVDYYSGGDQTSGCCDQIATTPVDDYAGYYSGGDPTNGSVYQPISSDDYADYYSGGDLTPGCCETNESPSTPSDDYANYYSGGDPTPGCCDAVETPETPVTPVHPVAPVTPIVPEVYEHPVYYPVTPVYTDYVGGSYVYNSTPSYGYNYATYGYTNYQFTYDYDPIPVGEYRRVAWCDSFIASKSRVDEGDRVTLTWSTSHADDVRISNGVGDVSDDGEKTVTIDEDTTFTLTASNSYGSDTCQVTVHVIDDEKEVRCDSFTVSDSRVDEDDYVTLKWRTTNADDVRISDGVGDVDDDGEKRVRVEEDTTFVLTARDGSDSDTCRVSVEVDEDQKSSGSLRCELAVSDKTITSGQRVKLSWDNRNADRVVLKDNHGREIADSRDDRDLDEDKDSIHVSPRETTIYKLTVHDGSKEKTCSVKVEVKNDVAVVSSRAQIPLSDIPYTGFEAGSLLTTIFYTILVLWGVGMGYFLVYRRRDEELVVASAAPLAATPVVASTLAPVLDEASTSAASFPFNLPTSEETFTEEEIEEETEDDAMMALETYAHERQVLLSSDALRFILSESQTDEERRIFLDTIIDQVKAKFPSEDGWTVINKERLMQLFS